MIKFNELTEESWKDLQLLFGGRGACGGCWCMYWRLSHKEFEAGKGDKNKKAMRRLVKQGRQLGILMYADDQPVGWCAAAPREDFIRLGSSRILKPVDDEKVWSIVCFFVKKEFRRKGYSVALLKEAVNICRLKGALILEGYPVDPKKGETPAAFAWTGTAAAFEKAGFKEVARRSDTRPIMRRYSE